MTNTYNWGGLAGCSSPGCPNGTAFTDFLGFLNTCTADPTNALPLGQAFCYVSSTTDGTDPEKVLGVRFSDGAVMSVRKAASMFVRAVRDAGEVSIAI